MLPNPAVVKEVIEHFGGVLKCSKAAGVSQPTVTAWKQGKHGISAGAALRIERESRGRFRAWQLCPELAEPGVTITVTSL